MAKAKRSKRVSVPPDTSGAELHDLLVRHYAIGDPDGLALAATAAAARDRALEAAEILAKEGVVVLDRWNQSKPHPACAIEAQAQRNLIAALRALDLEPTGIDARPGRPPDTSVIGWKGD